MLDWFKKKFSRKDEKTEEQGLKSTEDQEAFSAEAGVAEPEAEERESSTEADVAEPEAEEKGSSTEADVAESEAEERESSAEAGVAEPEAEERESSTEAGVAESADEEKGSSNEAGVAEPEADEEGSFIEAGVAESEVGEPASPAQSISDEEAEHVESPSPSLEKKDEESGKEPVSEARRKISLFKRLQERLGKTRQGLLHRLDVLFLGKKVIDEELLEELEEVLITSDLGVATTQELLDSTRLQVKRNELSDPQALKGVLRDNILTFLRQSDQAAELVMPDTGPFVIMVVGVNGVGKTTTIGKVANKFKQSGQSVLLIAADTFRAAAIDQLKIWSERVGVEIIAQEPGADPSAVVFDGLAYGMAHDFDVILIDTAGRLHTSVNLMEELKKIKRVIGKKFAGAPHEVLLVLDATTGQNGISQAKLFHEAVGVSGLTLTKLDGTAKGGIVANVCRELRIPVRFIGIGEQMDDLRDFDAEEFVDALFSREDGSESE